MNLTYDIALQKYTRLCAKSEREWQHGHSPLSPFLRAMSCTYEFSQPFPALADLMILSEQDRQDIILLLQYMASAPRVTSDFRKAFDCIEA